MSNFKRGHSGYAEALEVLRKSVRLGPHSQFPEGLLQESQSLETLRSCPNPNPNLHRLCHWINRAYGESIDFWETYLCKSELQNQKVVRKMDLSRLLYSRVTTSLVGSCWHLERCFHPFPCCNWKERGESEKRSTNKNRSTRKKLKKTKKRNFSLHTI